MEHIKGKFAIETRGTFADIIHFQKRDRRSILETLKVASTPAQPEQAVTEGTDRLVLEWSNMGEMLHGSTVATSVVLERRGAKSALPMAEGFTDTPEVQRGDRENVCGLSCQRRRPVIPRNMVYPVIEQATADGDVLKALEEDQIRSIAQELKREDVRSVGICYLHSYAFADHEARAKEILEKEPPNAIIATSYEILPQFREYERSSAVATTSYIAPVMVNHIEKLYGNLKHRNFKGKIFVTQSNGGTIPVGIPREETARTLLFGPAAGVMGATLVTHQLGIHNVITLGTGGTSADVCLVNNGELLVSAENKVDGSAIAVPTLDTVTAKAGGGSTAWLDNGGMLQVGPRSVEAIPGPTCYDRGGDQPTMSDTLAYRGFIHPEYFAGGNYPLNVENARHVMVEPADQVHTSPDKVAEAAIRIIEADTMQVAKSVSTERGYGTCQYTMIALDGDGGLHAINIAQELGIINVFVSCYAGTLSSLGLLVADVIRDYVQIYVTRYIDTTSEMLRGQFSQVREHMADDVVPYGSDREKIILKYAVDVRYLERAFEFQPDLDEIPESAGKLAEVFHEKYLARCGCNSSDNNVEIVNYRLKTVIPQDNRLLKSMKYSAKTDRYDTTCSKILVNEERIDCDFCTRPNLLQDARIQGSAMAEGGTTTCFIPKNQIGLLQDNGSLLLRREEN